MCSVFLYRQNPSAFALYCTDCIIIIGCTKVAMSISYELEKRPPRLVIYDEKNHRFTDTQAIDDLFAAGRQFLRLLQHRLWSLKDWRPNIWCYRVMSDARSLLKEMASPLSSLAISLSVTPLAFWWRAMYCALQRSQQIWGAMWLHATLSIAHELVGSTADVDLVDFMNLGRRLISEMAPYILEVMDKANTQHAAKRTQPTHEPILLAKLAERLMFMYGQRKERGLSPKL